MCLGQVYGSLCLLVFSYLIGWENCLGLFPLFFRTGKGAFGLVWCALRKSGGELVAVKQFQLGTPDVLSAVQLEVDILQSLKHPNIVGFLGVQQEESLGVVNLFLEFVSGGSLSGNLAQFGAFPESVVRRYGRQLLQALAYLHQRNVIHRDIKVIHDDVRRSNCTVSCMR